MGEMTKNLPPLYLPTINEDANHSLPPLSVVPP